ncbi:uncharacterized protein LOC110448427 [Mizuhopecten yessoensis]|uniref:Uncharacterized protein n=1 Tax=Mizuhopecten yessoensis TaxID=6573 RepID=A0A210QT74_MIZYE|nr:uncharacterized protein LOC110448427 [Mizuhopecten yessoensis]OWF51936.1 hypothetical protein KP79_PYT18488 [Mizuhopecten yessoensis]
MIFPIIMIALATTAVSQHPIQTLTNESSLSTAMDSEEDDLDAYTDSEPVTDVESENICKRVVISNITRFITFRVETRKKCQNSSEDCNKDGYKWVRSVRYRNLTVTERRSEHVCCDGFKNESGKCIKELSTAISNKTSGIMEREITQKLTILMIVLSVVGAVVLITVIVVIFKLECLKKRPSERQAYAHDNPVYDSTVGQSHVDVDNMNTNHEQPNPDVIADANTCMKSCQVGD